MANVDKVIKDLVINEMSQEEFDAQKAAGTIAPNEIYVTPDKTDDKLDKKVSVIQGEENAGKILIVNEDGEVVPDKPKVGASLPILTHVFADHKLNDISWLNADTFSWQSGDVYVAAFEHLVNDYISLSTGVLYAYYAEDAGETFYLRTDTPSIGDQLLDETGTPAYEAYGTHKVKEIYDDGSFARTATFPGNRFYRDTSKDVTLSVPKSETETISGITIRYYKADDGHKICMQDQEANVQALYEATGVAWYYIIDEANKRFKLPRTKHAFTGLRDSVGKYVPAGLPNITGTIGSGYGTASSIPWVSHTGTGALYAIQTSSSSYLLGGSTSTQTGLSKYGFDASRSNTTYGNSNTVQPPATQMYLYFYVGNFKRDALEQTAGITSEQLNNKADISDVQALESRTDILEQGDYVVASQEPTSSNGYTWYRKYKSGWVEQGGRWSGSRTIAQGDSGNVTPSLPIKMANKYYYVNAACEDVFCFLMNTNAEVHQCLFGWGAYSVGRTLSAFIWEVKGFAA